VLVLVLATVAGLELKDWLIEIVVAPLRGQKLIYLTPGGGFNFIFTLSLYFGALLTIPVAVLQLFRFLQPMLPRVSRKFTVVLIGTSSLLAVMGALLAYFLAIPAALGFLDGFTGSSITPNLTAESYLNFVVVYIVGLAMLFQLPLLLFLYDHIRPIPPGMLARSQRYGIVATTILAALITPSPDLMSYAIVLVPILGAYEFGVLVVYLRRKLHRDRAVRHEPVVVEQIVQSELIPVEPLVPEQSAAKPASGIIAAEPNAIRFAMGKVAIKESTIASEPIVAEPLTAAMVKPVVVRKLGRSIDGILVAHKTDVSAPAQPVQPKIIRKSIDGMLTMPAQA